MTEPTKDAWLEGVVQRNDRDLKRYLSQRVGNRAEVEDLAQEIYLRLLRIERKDLIRSPEALLFRVALECGLRVAAAGPQPPAP